MCGILGIISPGTTKSAFEQALQSFQYRGPEHSGVFHAGPVMLGHNRLSIIDPGNQSNQPFCYLDRYYLVFNGEIYNYRKLRKELLADGLKFRTDSDTEVVVAAFSRWGTDCFYRLHGMFALGIYDSVKHELFIARDRMGEKPLFYYHHAGNFCFASEIKGIRALIPGQPLDHTALVDYLSLGYIPHPKTIFRDIRKLEQGTWLKFDINTHYPGTPVRYFSIDLWSGITSAPEEELHEKFEDILGRVAGEILVADVPVGTFLSGGVDSSLATAVIHRHDSNVRAFTIGFKEAGYNELPYATRVARHLGMEHITRTITTHDVSEVYDALVDLYDEPFNDYSFVPTFYVCREARKFGKVIISGDGADELFCGYRKYQRLQRFLKLYKHPFLSRILAGSSLALPEHNSFRRQMERLGMDESTLLFDLQSGVFRNGELKGIAGPELLRVMKDYNTKEVTDNFLSAVPEGLSVLQKLRYLDLKMLLPDDMLVKVDRAGMVNSLEVRPFFLHPEIVNFAFSLPESQLVNHNQAKYFLKKHAEDMLPRDIIYRKKMGFVPPMREWLEHELDPMLNAALGTLPEAWFNRKGINRVLKMQQYKGRDFTLQIHSLMFLGSWLRKNNIA